MEEKSWLEILISWFPMLLLIVVWIFFMTRMRSRGGYFDMLGQLIEEVRRHNQILEGIAATLEKDRRR